MDFEIRRGLRHQKIAIFSVVFFLLILTTAVIIFLSQSVGQNEARVQSQASELDSYPLNSNVDSQSTDRNCGAVVEYGKPDGYSCYKTATITCVGGGRDGKIYRLVPAPIGWGGSCMSKGKWEDYANLSVCGCFTSSNPTPTTAIQL